MIVQGRLQLRHGRRAHEQRGQGRDSGGALRVRASPQADDPADARLPLSWRVDSMARTSAISPCKSSFAAICPSMARGARTPRSSRKTKFVRASPGNHPPRPVAGRGSGEDGSHIGRVLGQRQRANGEGRGKRAPDTNGLLSARVNFIMVFWHQWVLSWKGCWLRGQCFRTETARKKIFGLWKKTGVSCHLHLVFRLPCAAFSRTGSWSRLSPCRGKAAARAGTFRPSLRANVRRLGACPACACWSKLEPLPEHFDRQLKGLVSSQV
ncbi:MAG: hypothetical protein RL514_3779 [Verrucomicrobiota bacterium]